MKADLKGLTLAAAIVAKGGLISYPTDTVYGLGCDPLNCVAVQNLLRVKSGRTKALPVLVASIEDAITIADVSTRVKKLALKFWPGPLTMVLPAKDTLPSISAPDRTVGVRSPNHAICLQLLSLCSGLLVGTSANLTGHYPATSAAEVVSELGDKIDIVLDGGPSPLGVASTVIDLVRKRPVVLREGPIGATEIMRYIGEAGPR